MGYEEGGQLTERVKRSPYSVVLLDEIEKAHPDVFNLLLQVFEDGHLTDGLGNTVDFKNTILIMTSNIGAKHLMKREGLGFQSNKDEVVLEKMEEIVKSEVKRIFNPEFLNPSLRDKSRNVHHSWRSTWGPISSSTVRLRRRVKSIWKVLLCRSSRIL